jgi:hypothetical protein
VRVAKAMRMRMYNVAKRPKASIEVKAAREACMVQVEGTSLFVVRIEQTEMMRRIAMQAGIKTMEQEIREGEMRLMQGQMEAPAAAQKESDELAAELAKLMGEVR